MPPPPGGPSTYPWNALLRLQGIRRGADYAEDAQASQQPPQGLVLRHQGELVQRGLWVAGAVVPNAAAGEAGRPSRPKPIS